MKKIRVTVSEEDLLKLLHFSMTDSTATKADENLLNSLAEAYLSKSDLKSNANRLTLRANLKNVENSELLKVIIYILSVLTGFPESQIKLTTKLVEIGITPIKKETARKRINQYLKDKGGKLITQPEASKCETVNDLYTLALSKL